MNLNINDLFYNFNDTEKDEKQEFHENLQNCQYFQQLFHISMKINQKWEIKRHCFGLFSVLLQYINLFLN